MYSRDYRDIIGGLILLLFGVSFTVYAYVNYDLGTLRRMGPGMFPTILGVVLAVLGVFQVIPALKRPGTRPDIRVWSPIFVLAGCAAFALTIRSFGLLPAVAILTIVSSFAELEFLPVRFAVLVVALCLVAWVVFSLGLGLNLPMFRWPF